MSSSVFCIMWHESILANIGGTSVIESYEKYQIGISIDTDLSFENHVNKSCTCVGRKFNACSRHCKILPNTHKTLFHSQFAHCQLVWM